MTEQVDQGLADDELQGELRDLLALSVFGDHVLWVLTGDDAERFAEWLLDAVARWRALADQVAKHLVTLDVAPDGRVRALAQDIPLNWVPDGWLRPDEARRLVTDRLHAVAGRAGYRRSQASDAVTLQLFDAVCDGLESSPCPNPAWIDSQ